nr:hypothetical protein [Tanacetum cinerariifolium]
METGEEVREDKSTELGSNDTDEMVNVLSSIEATNILTSEVAAVSVSPVAGVSTKGVPTSKALSPAADEPASLLRDDRQAEAFPTVSSLDARQDKENINKTSALPHESSPRDHDVVNVIPEERVCKEKVVKSEVPKKRKLQEQIDAQVAKEMEEEFARENQRVSEQLVRDSEIARLHAKEELKMMIEGLDRSNEVITKHLQEYEQAAANLFVGEKIELINEQVKYQDHHTKILKYQAQQSKPLSKKEQREFYMSVLRSHAGWKTKHFRGMSLEEIKEKFIPVWKQLEDFVPMSSKEEGERVKKKGLKLDQGSAKRMKTFEDVSEEDLKGMMQLVHLEEVFVEALQRRSTSAVDFGEGNFKYQTDYKRQREGVIEWKLYDKCGVQHVLAKDQEIFMLVEKDYPPRKGLATMMISNRLQEEQYSLMANDLILKIHNIANSPR